MLEGNLLWSSIRDLSHLERSEDCSMLLNMQVGNEEYCLVGFQTVQSGTDSATVHGIISQASQIPQVLQVWTVHIASLFLISKKVPEAKSAFFFSMTQSILPLVNTRIQSNYILNCPTKCTCIIEYLCYLLNICYMFLHSLCHPQGELLSLLKTVCLLQRY